MIGAGDAGIENAIGLAADPAQGNRVTIVNRSADFATRQERQRQGAADDGGREGGSPSCSRPPPRATAAARCCSTPVTASSRSAATASSRAWARPRRAPSSKGCAEYEEKDGKKVIRPGTGIEFTSADRDAYPKLSPTFESTNPGIFVIGALAGYPLIKHCMNQGYDVVEFINGNTTLKPADEPILAAKFAAAGQGVGRPMARDLRQPTSTILKDVSPLQMREFMLDSEVAQLRAGRDRVRAQRAGDVAVRDRARLGSGRDREGNPSNIVPIQQGSIFGEVGLISGRRRGSTIRAAEPTRWWSKCAQRGAQADGLGPRLRSARSRASRSSANCCRSSARA